MAIVSLDNEAVIQICTNTLIYVNFEPILDNDTRWSSHYLSIERALKFEDRLRTFCIQNQDKIHTDTLTDEDWLYLQEIAIALEPFAREIKQLQGSAGDGRHGSVWKWLPTFEGLKKHVQINMKAAQAKYHLTLPLIVAYQQCWQKLDKYYLLPDEAPQICAAATLFSPFARKALFDKNWDQKWLNQMLETVKEHYKVHYADTGDTTEEKAQDDPSLVDIELGLVPNYKRVEDQFNAYIDEPPLHYKVDLLNWWAHSGFPHL